MLSLSSLFLKGDPAARSHWTSFLRKSSYEFWEPDHRCRMLGLQFSVVLPRFLRLEPREGRRGKRTEDRVLAPKSAPNPEGRETRKERDSPSRLGGGRFKKQGTYLQGLSWVQGGETSTPAPLNLKTFLGTLTGSRRVFSPKGGHISLAQARTGSYFGEGGQQVCFKAGEGGEPQLQGHQEVVPSLSVTPLTQSPDLLADSEK